MEISHSYGLITRGYYLEAIVRTAVGLDLNISNYFSDICSLSKSILILPHVVNYIIIITISLYLSINSYS